MGRRDSAAAGAAALAAVLMGAWHSVPGPLPPCQRRSPHRTRSSRPRARCASSSSRMRPGGSPRIRWPLIHARNTCWAPCTWPASVSARMPNARRLSSRPRRPKVSHAPPLRWPRLPHTHARRRSGGADLACKGCGRWARRCSAPAAGGQLPLQVDPRALATEPAVTLSMTIAAARRDDVDTLATLWPLCQRTPATRSDVRCCITRPSRALQSRCAGWSITTPGSMRSTRRESRP